MQVLDPLHIGQSVKEVLECDLQAELHARALYEEAATHCHAVKDYVSRDLFEKLMSDEEITSISSKPSSISSPSSVSSSTPSTISASSTITTTIKRRSRRIDQRSAKPSTRSRVPAPSQSERADVKRI